MTVTGRCKKQGLSLYGLVLLWPQDINRETNPRDHSNLGLSEVYLLIFILNEEIMVRCCVAYSWKNNLNYDVKNKTMFMITTSLLVLFSYAN